jgi:uncharacterized protein YjbJ (UPF0337 family)
MPRGCFDIRHRQNFRSLTIVGHTHSNGTPAAINGTTPFFKIGRTTPQRGKGELMKESTKDQAKGKAREIKGKLKEAAGRAANNPDMEAEGTSEKVAGKIQKKVGQVKKVFNQ